MSLIEISRADGSKVSCDTEKRSLTYYRYHVEFTLSEWKILNKLYSSYLNSISNNTSSLVTRGELISILWPSEASNSKVDLTKTRTIDVHVSSIRKKLNYIKGARIDSIYGYGYRLILLKRF